MVPDHQVLPAKEDLAEKWGLQESMAHRAKEANKVRKVSKVLKANEEKWDLKGQRDTEA